MISASAATSPPAAATIGKARLTPMIGTWPLRHTASAASFMRARLAARSAADLAPVPYGPPTMTHMEKLQRKTIGLECIAAPSLGGSGG
jgi:hypothetical protein